MAVRIGLGFGAWPFKEKSPDELWRYIEMAEEMDVDSIWLSDRVVSTAMSLEPIMALAAIAARTSRMLFGTSVIALPLRNPTVLAKEIATLDFLSGGRFVLAVGIGTDDGREYEACGVPKAQRAGRTDEAMQVMRMLWSQDHVTFHGKYFTLNDVTVEPKPTKPGFPPIWVGGRTDAALRRLARFGDGWLVSQATPQEVGAGIEKVKQWSAEFERSIEEDHYGVLFSYCIARSKEEAMKLAEPYQLRRRTDTSPNQFSAFGTADDMADLLDRYIKAGATKFVARPACPPDMMTSQLELLATEVIPRFHGRP